MSEAHFFTAEGALCRYQKAARLTAVAETVTCPACIAALRVRQLEEERPAATPKVIARLPAARRR